MARPWEDLLGDKIGRTCAARFEKGRETLVVSEAETFVEANIARSITLRFPLADAPGCESPYQSFQRSFVRGAAAGMGPWRNVRSRALVFSCAHTRRKQK